MNGRMLYEVNDAIEGCLFSRDEEVTMVYYRESIIRALEYWEFEMKKSARHAVTISKIAARDPI